MQAGNRVKKRKEITTDAEIVNKLRMLVNNSEPVQQPIINYQLDTVPLSKVPPGLFELPARLATTASGAYLTIVAAISSLFHFPTPHIHLF